MGYRNTVEDEQEQSQPKRYLYEVQVPVRGEVIFRVVATSEEDAREISSDWDWADGELNIEHDDSDDTHTVLLDEE